MKSLPDDQLLRHWAENRSQAAFAEIGRRYAALVFGVCLREIGNHAAAEDASQAVFLLLAQKAPYLRREGALAGWLFRAAQLVSHSWRRQERRRVNREAQAGQEQLAQRGGRDENALWDEIEPLLNDALARLKPADREAVLLRHFEGRSLAEIGAALGVSENTARMRVARAIEKLRVSLSKAGVVVSVSLLAALLSQRGAQAAPAALTQAIARIAAHPAGAGHLAPSSLTTSPLHPAPFSSRAQMLAKGAKNLMILSTVKTVALIFGTAAITLFAGGAAKNKIMNNASEGRAEELLTKAADAIQKINSLTCDCDKTSHDPDTGRAEHKLYVVRLLRPNFVREDRYQLKGGEAGAARERLTGLLSDGKTRRTLLPNNQAEEEAADPQGRNVGLLLPDPLYDFYNPENAYAELVRQARAEKTLASLTLDAPETWEGATYQVVTFIKAGKADGKPYAYKTRLYVGADNLVHRASVQDGAGVVLDDIALRNVRVNAPLTPSAFRYTPQPIVPSPPKPTAPALLRVGAFAPDFTLTDSRGKPVTLAQFRGKTVVLDFWATWCKPCLMSLPDTNRIAAQRAGKGVVALAVNVSDAQAAFDRWVPRHPEYSALRFVIDPRRDGTDIGTALYHVSSLPTQYVINPQGVVTASFVGYHASVKELERALDQAAK